LPIPGDDQLGAIQELRAIKEGPGEIGAVEHRLEQVRPVQAGTREIRTGKIGPPKVGALHVSARKIEPVQIEATQAGARQIRCLFVFRPPGIPCRGTASEHGTCASFGISYSRQTFGQPCSAVAMCPIDLRLRQALGAAQISIGQIRTVEPRQTQIGAA